MCNIRVTYYSCRRCAGQLTGTDFELPHFEIPSPQKRRYCIGKNDHTAKYCPLVEVFTHTQYWCNKRKCVDAELRHVGMMELYDMEKALRNRGFREPDQVPRGIHKKVKYDSDTNGRFVASSKEYMGLWRQS